MVAEADSEDGEGRGTFVDELSAETEIGRTIGSTGTGREENTVDVREDRGPEVIPEREKRRKGGRKVSSRTWTFPFFLREVGRDRSKEMLDLPSELILLDDDYLLEEDLIRVVVEESEEVVGVRIVKIKNEHSRKIEKGRRRRRRRREIVYCRDHGEGGRKRRLIKKRRRWWLRRKM